ncbi:MAG: hypothetical protein ACR2MY_12760 [Candidatus Dormibacteria bacterium]
MAYEMLTGRVPYQAATPAAVLIAQVKEPLPLPRTVNPALSQEIEAVLVRGLAKDPESRYGSAAQMVTALGDVAHTTARPAADGPTTPAVLPTPTPPLWTSPRVWLAAVAALVLVAIVGIGGWALAHPRATPSPALIAGGATVSPRQSAIPISPSPAASAATPQPADAVPRGPVLYDAGFTAGTKDLTAWTTNPVDATQSLTGTTLEYQILKAAAFAGHSMNTPQFGSYVAEIRFQLPARSLVTTRLGLALGDNKTFGDHFLHIDPDVKQLVLFYRPPNRPDTEQADIIGQPIDAPWIVDGQPHLVDDAVTQSSYTVYADGAMARTYAEARTDPATRMEISAFGNTGRVIISRLAAFALK